MTLTSQNEARTTEISRITETGEHLGLIRQQVKEIIDGPAFRGSHRSGQFLKYIVEQAIAGHYESLKERVIGVELFGRSPTYDTGEDAIVRVTASDVRKRLLQHYGRQESPSQFRIGLPPGSYIPEITRNPGHPEKSATANHHAGSNHPVAAVPAALSASPVLPHPRVGVPSEQRYQVRWVFLVIAIVAINILVWRIFLTHAAPSGKPSTSASPWPAFFHSQHPTFLITSDPNIAEIQGITGSSITASEYANQEYIPSTSSLSPQLVHFCRDILRGDKAAIVDTPIVAGVAALAQADSSRISVRGARDLRFADLDTENNFVFLGSPRSDPWTSLFSDQLDFRFFFDRATDQEILQDVHPRSGEAATYVSTAKGYGTGEAFATISFIANPDHAGQVLLLGGANAEGTKAAGELVTNSAALATALRQCGIHSPQQMHHFQLLLRVSIMAGSPRSFDVLACHLLR